MKIKTYAAGRRVLFLVLFFVFTGLIGAEISVSAQAQAAARREAAPPPPAPKPQHARLDLVAAPAVLTPETRGGVLLVELAPQRSGAVILKMAPHAVTLIEFPASDPVYAIHPGDENFVTVDRKNKRATDAIILRPGENFALGDEKNPPSTVVTIQRVSGIVVSFIIYPTRRIEENANYVVVSYDPRQIQGARLGGGLAANLAADAAGVAPLTTVTTLADKPAAGDGSPSNSVPPEPINTSAVSPSNNNSGNTSSAPASDKLPVPPPVTAESVTVGVLQNYSLRQPVPQLAFGKSLHGLSLALPQAPLSQDGYIVALVAVKNTLKAPVVLLPEQPEIFIENRSKGQSALLAERIKIEHIATTLTSNLTLAPQQIAYFAVSYRAPILGAKQALRLQFAQTTAADEPVVTYLGVLSR